MNNLTDEAEEFLPPEVSFDANNPETVNAARKKASRIRQKRMNFVRQMMNDENGRLWMYDYLLMGHMAEPTHTPGDPYATAFKEGERNFANRMLYDINEACPEMYSRMLLDGRNEK